MPKQPSTFGVPHHHVKRAIVWYLVILVAGAVAIYVLSLKERFQQRHQTPEERAATVPQITEYSLGGEITAIDTEAQELTVRIGWVQKTAKGNEFVYYNRTVTVTPNTKILIVTTTGTTELSLKDGFKKLKTGDTVTVYGSGNPYVLQTLEATKIEVNR